MQELENVNQKKPEIMEKPEKTVRFVGIEEGEEIIREDSSEESVEDEEDYLETQRLNIKLGSDARVSENKSEKKQRKKKKPRVKAEKKEDQNELPMIEQLLQDKQKSKKQQEEENEKNVELKFIAGEKFKQQLILEELERKKNAERQKDMEEMKRLQEKFKNEIEENKRKKKEKKMKEVEEQAILVLEQKYLYFNGGFY